MRLILISILFVFLLITPVFAGWTFESQTGTWITAQHNNYESGWDDDLCELWFNQTVANFTAWTTTFTGQIVQDAMFVDTSHDIAFWLRGTGGIEIGLQVKNWRSVGINFFGYQWVITASGIAFWGKTATDWTILDQSTLLVNWKVKIFRSAETTLTFQAEGYTDPDWKTCVVNAETNVTLSSAWFTQVTLWQGIREDSYSLLGFNGKVIGTKTQEQIITNIPYTEYELSGKVGIQQTLIEIAWQSITQATGYVIDVFTPVAVFLGDVAGYLSFGGIFIINLFSQMTQYLPLIFTVFPIFLFFFVIEHVGNWDFKPVTELFLAIYHFFASIINMLVNIAQTIWAYIKVW